MEDDVDDDENDKSSEQRRDKEKLLQKLKDDKVTKSNMQSENTNRDRLRLLDRFSKSTESHGKTKNILTKKLLKQGLQKQQRRNSFPSVEESVRLDIYDDIDKALNADPLGRMSAGRDINSTYGFISRNLSPLSADNLHHTDLSFLKYRESEELTSCSESTTFQRSDNDNTRSTDTEMILPGGETGLNRDDMADYTEEISLESLNKLRLQDEERQQLSDLDRINKGLDLEVRKRCSTDNSDRSAMYIHRQGDSDADSTSVSITTQRNNSRQGLKSFECTDEERQQKLAKWRETQEQMDLSLLKWKLSRQQREFDTERTEGEVEISEPENVKTASQQQNKSIEKVLQGTHKAIITTTSQAGKYSKEVRQIEDQQRKEGFHCNLKIPQNEEEMNALRQKVIRVSIQRCSADIEKLKHKLQADMEELNKQETMVVHSYRNSFRVTRKINEIIKLVESDKEHKVTTGDFVNRVCDAQRFYDKSRCHCDTTKETRVSKPVNAGIPQEQEKEDDTSVYELSRSQQPETTKSTSHRTLAEVQR